MLNPLVIESSWSPTLAGLTSCPASVPSLRPFPSRLDWTPYWSRPGLDSVGHAGHRAIAVTMMVVVALGSSLLSHWCWAVGLLSLPCWWWHGAMIIIVIIALVLVVQADIIILVLKAWWRACQICGQTCGKICVSGSLQQLNTGMRN